MINVLLANKKTLANIVLFLQDYLIFMELS